MLNAIIESVSEPSAHRLTSQSEASAPSFGCKAETNRAGVGKSQAWCPLLIDQWFNDLARRLTRRLASQRNGYYLAREGANQALFELVSRHEPHEFEDQCHIFRWLWIRANQRIIDTFRQQTRDRCRTQSLDDEQHDGPASTDSRWSRVHGLTQELHDRVARLPAALRPLSQLAFVDLKNDREIAAALFGDNFSEGDRQRVRRLRLKAQGLLMQLEPPGTAA